MDRREFLHWGMLTGSATAAGAGCAGPGLLLLGDHGSDAEITNEEMAAFFSRLDRSMAAIPKHRSFGPFMNPASAAEFAADPEHGYAAELFHKGLRSMLLAGSFRDLPERAR